MTEFVKQVAQTAWKAPFDVRGGDPVPAVRDAFGYP